MTLEYGLLKTVMGATETLLERLPTRTLHFRLQDHGPEYSGWLKDGKPFHIQWSWEGVLQSFTIGTGNSMRQWRSEVESPLGFIERVRPEIPEVGTWHDRLGTV